MVEDKTSPCAHRQPERLSRAAETRVLKGNRLLKALVSDAYVIRFKSKISHKTKVKTFFFFLKIKWKSLLGLLKIL